MLRTRAGCRSAGAGSATRIVHRPHAEARRSRSNPSTLETSHRLSAARKLPLEPAPTRSGARTTPPDLSDLTPVREPAVRLWKPAADLSRIARLKERPGVDARPGPTAAGKTQSRTTLATPARRLLSRRPSSGELRRDEEVSLQVGPAGVSGRAATSARASPILALDDHRSTSSCRPGRGETPACSLLDDCERAATGVRLHSARRPTASFTSRTPGLGRRLRITTQLRSRPLREAERGD